VRPTPTPTACLLACLAATVAIAQDAPPAGEAAPPKVTVARAGRVPLLGEGTVLVGAVGRVSFDEVDRVWVFSPRVSSQELERALVILPGEVRAEIEAVAAGDRSAIESRDVELFGKVLVHRGRNYLLASAIGFVESTAPTVAPAPEGAGAPPVADPSDAFLAGDDAAARLEAELLARADRAPRAVSVDAGVEVVPVREHRLHSRRGHLRRDLASGTMIFVPEADGTGARDPQLELLPCAMLERLEAAASSPSAPRILRVSGLVIEEGSSRYLLPTGFSAPREGRGISP